jgi:hypothetical protein
MTLAPVVFSIMLLFATVVSAKSSQDATSSDSRVYVPWEEFKGIVDRLSEPDTVTKEIDVAPVDYVLTSSEIKGSVIDNKSARFTVLLNLTVLPGALLRDNGWISIPLGTVNSTSILGSVTLQGKPLPLTTDNNEYRILLSKAGSYAIELTYHCNISGSEGTNRIELYLPKTMASKLVFTIPEAHADVVVNGLKTVTQKAGSGLQVTTAISLAQNLQIEYTPIGTVQEGGDDTNRVTPRVYATTGLLVDIKENQIKYQYRLDYQIWHKKVTLFAIALPDTYSIEAVEGAGISSWKMERQEGKPVLTVHTNFTPEKNYSLTVKFSRKVESTSDRSSVPSLKALNVHRESGCVAIAAQQTMEVSVDDSINGVTAIDQSELPGWMQERQDLLMRFKYINPPFTLFLNVKRHSDMPVLVAIADSVKFTTLLTSDGYMLSKIRYQLRNNHKQYLRVKMAGGWRLWSALIDGGPVMPASAGDDELLVPMRKMSADDNTGGFVLELVYWREWKKMGFIGRFEFNMPVIDVNSQHIDGLICVPKEFRYASFGGSLKKTGTSIGSEYFMSSMNNTSSYSDQQRMKRFSMAANQQMGKSRQGLALTLPVEITVPAAGIQHRFTKNLTISGEKVECHFSFRKALPGFGKAFGFVLQLAFLIAGFVIVYVPLNRRTRKSLVMSLSFGMMTFFILLIIKTTIFNSNGAGALLFFIGAAVGATVYGAFASKRGATAGVTAVLLFLLCFINPPPVVAQDDDTELDRSTVAIPWSDFKGILDKIKKPLRHDTTEIVPPFSYVISAGEYKGRKLNERQFEFSVRLTVSVLERTTWVSIPLMQDMAIYPDIKVNVPPSGKAVIGATAGNTDDGFDGNEVIVKGAGTYEINYHFAVPVNDMSGVSLIEFPMPRQAAASICIELDKPDYKVTVNNMPLAPRTIDKNHTLYAGATGTQENAVLSWRQEATRISAQDAMLLGTVNTFYSLGMGLIQMKSEISLNVIHQDIHEFTFSLPRNTDVIDVTGPAVLTWERVDTAHIGERQNIKVLFKYSVHDNAVFLLTAEQTYGDSECTVSMPDLLLNNASRQEGFVAVGVTSNIELEQKEQSVNVLRKDRRELPPWFEAEEDLLFAYQYLSGLYNVSFNIKRHDNVSGLAALVEQAQIRSVIRDDGKTITELTMSVKNRGEQFLRFKWKTDWQLWSLYCNNEPARPSYDSTARELLVPLEKASEQSAITAVKLVYLAQNRSFGFAGNRRLELPSVNMPVQNVSYAAYIPQNVDVMHTSGNLHPTEVEKQAKTPWFAWAINLDNIRIDGGLNTTHVVTPLSRCVDFYEKLPEEQISKSVTSTELPLATKEKKLMPRKSMGGTMGGGGDPRARVTQKGALGNDLFAKGGFATGVDEIIQGTGGLNGRGSQTVGRKGTAGIGYGAGYGSGYGGSGTGDVDDLIGQLADEKQAAAPSSAVDAGQLSLPIEISFDGKMHSYQNVLLKAGENPVLSFFYRKTPMKTPFLIHLLIFILTAIAGVFLTVCIWSGWKRRTVLYGISFPLAGALIICRWCNMSLKLDWIVLIPLLFFIWRIGMMIVNKIKNFRDKEKALLNEIEAEEATKKESEVVKNTPSQQEQNEQEPELEGSTK